MNNSTFVSSNVISNVSSSGGGAICNLGGNFSVTGSTFTDNTANYRVLFIILEI